MPVRVLVVDDEVDFLESLVMRLNLRGLEARGVSSGADALDHLADHEVDVVVLDLKMPGMDGIDALREIRRRFPKIAVIVMTGHGSQELSRAGLELGAFDYLIKPVKIDTVVERIRSACSTSGAGHAG